MCSAYKRCSLLAILLVIALYSPALKAAPSDQVHGSLVVTIADYFAENRSETRYFIKDQSQPGRTYELLFAATPRGDLRTGMVVTGSKPLNAFYTFRIGALLRWRRITSMIAAHPRVMALRAADSAWPSDK